MRVDDSLRNSSNKIYSAKGDHRHNDKYGKSLGEQNAHAHVLNCSIKPDVTVPLRACRMQLGTWQSILLIEMDGSRTRTVQVQVMGE